MGEVSSSVPASSAGKEDSAEASAEDSEPLAVRGDDGTISSLHLDLSIRAIPRRLVWKSSGDDGIAHPAVRSCAVVLHFVSAVVGGN